MPRSIEEILKVEKELEEAFKSEFNTALDISVLEFLSFKLLQERQVAFIRKRIGHLPDADLLALNQVLRDKLSYE